MSVILTGLGTASGAPLLLTQSWPAGAQALGPAAIPAKHSRAHVVVDFTQIADLLASITLSVDVSFDAGLTFATVGGFTLDIPNSGCTLDSAGLGPGLVDQFGVPFRASSFNIPLARGTLSTRMIRGSLVLTQPATVGATLVIW